MFEKIKKYYDLNLYNKEHLEQFVKKGVLTKKELSAIIGK